MKQALNNALPVEKNLDISISIKNGNDIIAFLSRVSNKTSMKFFFSTNTTQNGRSYNGAILDEEKRKMDEMLDSALRQIEGLNYTIADFNQRTKSSELIQKIKDDISKKIEERKSALAGSALRQR